MKQPKTVLEIVRKYEEDIKKAHLGYHTGKELHNELERIHAEEFIPVGSLDKPLQEGETYQIVTIQHPEHPKVKALLNIWFMEEDIVLGGLGWHEYNNYEKLHQENKKLNREPNTCPKCGKKNPYHYDFDLRRCTCSNPKCRHKWIDAMKPKKEKKKVE